MMKLGSQGIAAIYLGGQKIKKAYLGEAVVFDTAGPPEPVTYTITLSVDPQSGGTVTGGGSVEEGMSVTVSSTPAGGYTFSGWRENGAIVSTSPSYTFTVTSDRSLTAVFAAEVQSYNIVTSVDPAGAGTASGGGTYTQGQSVTLQAVPASGYQFVAWREAGADVSTDAAYTFTASGNRTITAVFAAIIYTVTTSTDPAGSGTTIITGTGTYQQGESVTVTASPDDGYKFVKWTEGGQTVSESASYTFTVSGDRALVAVFETEQTSRLPAGYQELMYIGVTASINTTGYSRGGIHCITPKENRPNHNTDYIPKIYLDYQLDSIPAGSTYAASNATIFGNRLARTANNVVKNTYRGAYCSAGQITFNYRSASVSYASVTTKLTLSAVRTKLTIDLTAKLLTINSASYPLNVTGTGNYPCLNVGYFACDWYSSGISGTTSHALIPGKLYEVKAWDKEGNLIVHCVPAREINTGKLGMYDMVNSYFIAASSYSTTTPGAEV